MNRFGELVNISILIIVIMTAYCCAAEPENGSSADLLTLEKSVGFALRNSYEVKIAKLDLYVAETGTMYAESVFDTFLYGGASYSEDKKQQLSVFSPDDNQNNVYYIGLEKELPTGTKVSAEWSDARIWSNSSFVSKNPAHDADLEISLEQPVGKNMFGYVDRATITLAKLAVDNADLSSKDQIEELISQVENAYLDALFAKRTLETFKGILAKAKELHLTNTKNYDLGVIEKVDFLASEANVAGLESDVLVNEALYKNAKEVLKRKMNMETEKDIILEDSLKIGDLDISLTDCLKKAFQERRDYKIGKREVDIKGLELKINENLKWPEVDLTASFEMNGLEKDFEKAARKTTVNDNTAYYAGVEFTVPIENKAARSEYSKSLFEKEQAILRLKDTERNIITEVSNAYRNVKAYEGSIIYISKTVELQRGKLEEEEKRFNYGRSTTKRLIDYQQDLLRAELEEARFLKEHRKSVVALNRAMNILLEKYKGLL